MNTYHFLLPFHACDCIRKHKATKLHAIITITARTKENIKKAKTTNNESLIQSAINSIQQRSSPWTTNHLEDFLIVLVEFTTDLPERK